MKPDPAQVLETVGFGLIAEVAPHVRSAYVQSALAIQAALLLAAREEFDRAAAWRVEENQAMRALFADAVDVVGDDRLRQRLRDAAATVDASLLVPDLDRANRSLRGLLVELHAHVEGVPGAAAKHLEAAIWRELRLSTERRRLSLAVF
jgi:hypothetical protein